MRVREGETVDGMEAAVYLQPHIRARALPRALALWPTSPPTTPPPPPPPFPTAASTKAVRPPKPLHHETLQYTLPPVDLHNIPVDLHNILFPTSEQRRAARCCDPLPNDPPCRHNREKLGQAGVRGSWRACAPWDASCFGTHLALAEVPRKRARSCLDLATVQKAKKMRQKGKKDLRHMAVATWGLGARAHELAPEHVQAGRCRVGRRSRAVGRPGGGGGTSGTSAWQSACSAYQVQDASIDGLG